MFNATTLDSHSGIPTWLKKGRKEKKNPLKKSLRTPRQLPGATSFA